MGLFGHWLAIQCYKHDGSLHRCWDRGLVLANNDDYVVVATKRAKVMENNGRRWFTKEPAVTIFSKKEWWNAICMIKPDGICYYCNIASPSLLTKESIRYIDYDLDTKLFTNKEIRVLDEKEYAHHRETYKYSDDLDIVLKYTTKKIVQRMKNNEFPFDEETIKKYYEQYLGMTNKK
jgi:protein associated with RNAse G/E